MTRMFWRRPFASVDAIRAFDAPWRDGRTPLHDIIAAARSDGRDVADAMRSAEPERDENELRWAPGAREHILGPPEAPPTDARTLTSALGNTLRAPTKANAAHLYKLLREGNTLAVIDDVLPRITREVGDRRDALAVLARRVVCEAPDMEPVKAGLALLGASGTPDDAALFIAMGAYDEFTLYAATALGSLLSDPEPALWALAKGVHGWGRVDTVERLAHTQNPEIRDWMLREGFRNGIMYEYLAYTCATTGDLRAAITARDVDDEMLVAAGEILSALITGQPGTPIEDYADGASVCLAFLGHVTARPLTNLRTIDAALRIGKLLDDEGRRRSLPAKFGWAAEKILEMRTLIGTILRSAEARAAVEGGLTAADNYTSSVAADLAPSFEIDPWPLRLARQRDAAPGMWDQWWHLMRTNDPERIEQVLDLARARLDLQQIASGPSLGLGLGEAFKDDSALDFVVQDLGRFPGQGFDLIKVALKGRSVRLRNMAIRALHAWGREAWPSDAAGEVEAAAAREPDEDVRQRFRDLLAGTLRD